MEPYKNPTEVTKKTIYKTGCKCGGNHIESYVTEETSLFSDDGKLISLNFTIEYGDIIFDRSDIDLLKHFADLLINHNDRCRDMIKRS